MNTSREHAKHTGESMKVSLVIETSDSRYEVLFDIDDPQAAQDRLADVLGDVEKRYAKRRVRPQAPTTAKSSPTTVPAPGGAK